MSVHIEGFDQNNNFITKTINTHFLSIKKLGKWSHYNWFKNGTELSLDYNDWEENDTYEIMYNNIYINIYLNFKYKIIMTPLININITIKELKNILSIKDNIYFDSIKLKDNKTLNYYHINNLDILECIQEEVDSLFLTDYELDLEPVVEPDVLAETDILVEPAFC